MFLTLLTLPKKWGMVGTCCQRVNLCRLSVLWMSTIMLLLKHGVLLGFIWLLFMGFFLFFCFCNPSFSRRAFWLTCLACSDCLCCYEPVLQMVEHFSSIRVSVHIGCQYNLWGEWNVYIRYTSLLTQPTEQPSHLKSAWLDYSWTS